MVGTSRVSTFDKTIQQTNELLKEIEKEFGWEGQREIAYDALRAVLHTLRDRLTVEEAADFSSQLPLLLKGVFYDGWKPAKIPVKMDKDEFFSQVRSKFQLYMEHSAQDLVRGVLASLRRFVSQGEMKEAKDVLPEQIAGII